jgi:hypothetical protein
MELAIPVVLLGGMYVLSNQDDKVQDKKQPSKRQATTQEGFVANRRLPESRQRQLPNTNTPEMNYPKQGTSELVKNVGYYKSANAATDRYYQQAVYEANAENDTNTYTSLTGEQVTGTDLKHNNMVPFFGSSVKQNTRALNNNESRLDNLNGSGSQIIHKKEIAPLFKPEENVQWGHGMPNQSDFIQSRVNPSMSMNNVKPFQEVRVGPGLNQSGGVLGSGGFNAGMEARERWIAKSVDELRTKNNPKMTYGGVVLGGKRDVQNRGIMGKMEKHRPDTYYINSPERYFTTTGLEKAQRAREEHLLKPENRETTTREYFGTVGDQEAQATYTVGAYRKPMRPQLDPNVKHVTNAYARGANEATDGDHGVQGYKSSVLPNNRTFTGGQQEYGGVSSFAKAVVAPLLDVFRTTRKENVIGNARPVGNARNPEATAGVVYNPHDKTRTTIREMTENRPDHMFVNNQREAGGYGYSVKAVQPTSQERDTTNTSYTGIGGNTAYTSNAPTYNAAYNANLIDKAPISRGRAPTTSNAPLFNGQTYTNIHIDKNDCDRNNNRMWVPQQVTKASPAKEQYGYGSARTEYGQDVQCQRNQPEILNAFNSNPYTKSLQSWA